MKNAFIAWFATNKNLKFLLCGITIFLVILIAVMLIPPCSSIFMYIAGEKAKLELIKFVGWGISGLIAIFGVVGLFQRAEALEKQNKINEDAHNEQAKALNKQHEMTEKGHIHERFKAATEHLGNERDSVRIAAFNEFYRLAKITAKITEEKGLKETIFDILCAHLRQITKDKNYQKKENDSITPGSTEIKPANEDYQKRGEEANAAEFEEIRPTEEVQSLLKILFKPDNEGKFIFVDMIADLEGANLQGANLQKANLQRANLQETNLKKANLTEAKLQNAVLQETNLQRAVLEKTELQCANMTSAYLQYAKLKGTYLQEAYLHYAHLQEADLLGANLQGASLYYAHLQGADLLWVNLQGASLQAAEINKNTNMPRGWKDIVKKDEDGKTGVLRVDDKGSVKERL